MVKLADTSDPFGAEKVFVTYRSHCSQNLAAGFPYLLGQFLHEETVCPSVHPPTPVIPDTDKHVRSTLVLRCTMEVIRRLSPLSGTSAGLQDYRTTQGLQDFIETGLSLERRK